MYKTHLQRIQERHSNAAEFFNAIFPLEGAELAFVSFFGSSGYKQDATNWYGDGYIDFTIGVKDGANPIDVLAEFSAKAKTSKLRGDLKKLEVVNCQVRKDESHTNKLRNGVWAAEIHCVFYVHYDMMDCVTAAREREQ